MSDWKGPYKTLPTHEVCPPPPPSNESGATWNAAAPAFPSPTKLGLIGVTKRELFAAMAMQGISIEEYTRFGLCACIDFAIAKADALLAALEQTK